MTEGEGAVPDLPFGKFSTRGCVDENGEILSLGILEGVREDRLPDDWNGGPRRLVDGGGGHGETRQCRERRLAMPAIVIILSLGPKPLSWV